MSLASAILFTSNEMYGSGDVGAITQCKYLHRILYNSFVPIRQITVAISYSENVL